MEYVILTALFTMRVFHRSVVATTVAVVTISNRFYRQDLHSRRVKFCLFFADSGKVAPLMARLSGAAKVAPLLFYL